MARQGQDELDALLHITNHVMGMDPDPVAVAVAGTNYLLALGDVVRGPHPPVLVPVYMADALNPPDAVEGEEPVYVIKTSLPDVDLEVPESVAEDPDQLDLLFHRLPQYLHAARLRAPTEGDTRATEEVMGSIHAYLTSPKRSGLRQLPPLSPFAAEVMCRTARTLIRLALEGTDGVWLHVLKNAPAPVYLSRHKFDLVVGDLAGLPTEQAAQIRDRLGALYLGEDGRNALTL